MILFEQEFQVRNINQSKIILEYEHELHGQKGESIIIIKMEGLN